MALDHLRETDDRVERRAQLVDQLAERIGGKLRAEHARWFLIRRSARDLVGPRPPGGAAIAAKGAARRIEPGDAGNAPVAGGRALPRHGEARVAEWAAFLEGASGLAVDAMLAAPGDPGDALSHQRATGGAFDPDQYAVRPGLPAKGLRRRFGRRRHGGRGLAALAVSLDPVDQLADLGIAARFARRGYPGRHRALDAKVAGSEGLKRSLHFGRQIFAVAQQ